MTPGNLFFGWRPHTPQSRLLIKSAKTAAGILDAVEPAAYSDLTWQTRVRDQQNLGSCTAFALSQAITNALLRAGLDEQEISELWAYYVARAWAGDQAVDNGSQVSTLFEVASKGIPLLKWWPYDVTRFAEMPDTMAFAQAQTCRGVLGVDYIELGDADPLDNIRKALSAGMTIAFGSPVTTQYTDSEPTEIIHDVGATVVGGHAQVVCGHDDAREFVTVMGSWGAYGDPACPPGCSRWGYDFVRRYFSDLCLCPNPPRFLEVQP